MTALADAAFLVESLDLKTDYSPLHRDDLCGGSHHCADRRRGKMADIDFGADRDPASFKTGLDGVGGGELHLQDHHRRRIDHRHARHEMSDRAVGWHHQASFGAHADLDDVACVHGFSFFPLPLRERVARKSVASSCRVRGLVSVGRETPHPPSMLRIRSRCEASASSLRTAAECRLRTLSHKGRGKTTGVTSSRSVRQRTRRPSSCGSTAPR